MASFIALWVGSVLDVVPAHVDVALLLPSWSSMDNGVSMFAFFDYDVSLADSVYCLIILERSFHHC